MIALLLVLLAAAGYFALVFPGQVQKLNYPIANRELIERYASEYHLDPARVQAVIFCESSNRADAVSSVGARGLMQIMPDTGEWIAGKLGEADSYHVDRLFEPELSIRYGCWYLNYLDSRYALDMTCATAAYHNGPGNVDKWLKDAANSKDGATLSSIPSNATDTYVKRVRRAYEQYKELYANES